MIFPLLRDILRSPVTEIILHIKKSPGLSVKEMCALMDMSYMGVKQHCMELEKKGCLDTWRRPKAQGRPEKVYRLTSKLDPLFPRAGEEMLIDTLKHAERIFGPTAAEKLLYAYFQAKAETWQERLSQESELENKVIQLARLRSAEGTLSEAEMSSGGALRLVDYNCPWEELVKKYPLIAEIECELIERLLECSVERVVEEHSGLKRVIYRLKRPD
jgi:predicted ArsR family transcriptional regulator